MKTRLYTLLTGLLMAACLTSHGQETVNQFKFLRMDKDFFECNLFENEDGTLMFRTLMCTPNTYENWQHLLYKATPEGEVLDSLVIDGSADYSYLLRNPVEPDSYILTEDYWIFDTIDSLFTAYLRMVFIDDELNIHDDISVPLLTPDTNSFYVNWDPWFFDTQNDLIVSFWTDDVLHLRRIGLDGTVKTAHETTELFAPNYESEPCQPGGDTTLVYSEMGFGVFSESPLTYYKLGGYYPLSGAWPIFGYFFDADFNLIESRPYLDYNGDIAFDGANSEHIIPLKDDTYLTVTQITRVTQSGSGVGVAKFDMNHNSLATSPLFGANNCYPLQTVITDDNTIYQLYVKYSQNVLALARLDGDLNLLWDIPLSINHMFGYYYGMSCMIQLKNGDLVIGGLSRRYSRYCASFITLHDDYDAIQESTTQAHPYALYPNPVKNQLNLSFANDVEPESIDLYDLQGRLVGTKRNDLEGVDMSALAAGVYMLRITLKDGTSYYDKVIKE